MDDLVVRWIVLFSHGHLRMVYVALQSPIVRVLKPSPPCSLRARCSYPLRSSPPPREPAALHRPESVRRALPMRLHCRGVRTPRPASHLAQRRPTRAHSSAPDHARLRAVRRVDVLHPGTSSCVRSGKLCGSQATIRQLVVGFPHLPTGDRAVNWAQT